VRTTELVDFTAGGGEGEAAKETLRGLVPPRFAFEGVASAFGVRTMCQLKTIK